MRAQSPNGPVEEDPGGRSIPAAPTAAAIAVAVRLSAASRALTVWTSTVPCCWVTQPLLTKGWSRLQVTWASSRLAFACSRADLS